MTSKLYVVVFTILLTAVLGLLVSGVNALLRERSDLNKLVAKESVILELLELKPPSELWPPEKVVATFKTGVKALPKPSDDPRAYIYYAATDPARTTLAIPIAGQGFWDKIEGFLAIDPKTETVRGIAFTNQLETPGLGARIEESWFREQFKGKSYAKEAEGKRLRLVAPGGAPNPHAVDAITGATETSRAVEKLLNDSIERFLRQQEAKP